jgi:hypothetical protein
MVSTAFIRDFLIGEADIASFSCYSKPSAQQVEHLLAHNRQHQAGTVLPRLLQS